MQKGISNLEKILDSTQVTGLINEALKKLPLANKKVLVIVPDHTRSSPMDMVFPCAYGQLKEMNADVEVIVALGTHPPEDIVETRARLGITDEDVKIHMHEWQNNQMLTNAGSIASEVVREISGGLFEMDVPVRAHNKLFEADAILVIGPVFPHEVVGFSGGSKYLFPGCSGPEILNFFHWLGAVITNAEIIGVKDTPVRQVLERAAAMVTTPQFGIKMVLGKNGLAGIWCGDLQEAWSEAANLAAKTHIKYINKPVKRVLSVAPRMYDDLWTAAKCMYKLEPVVADGGELIIYAPHVTEVSVTHGELIEQVGYHVRDYFLKQWDTFKDKPWGVLAHSTHVKGSGEYDAASGVETPRIEVTLATGISKEVCDKINLGYRNPDEVNQEEFKNCEEEGILFVPKAGEMLYRLSDTGKK